MTETKRIKKVVSWLISQGIILSQKDLGEKIGISNKSYLSQLVNADDPNDELINKLIELDPRLSHVWMKTGAGEMLISDVQIQLGDGSQQSSGDHSKNEVIDGHSIEKSVDLCRSSVDALISSLEEIKEQRKDLINEMRSQREIYASSLERHDALLDRLVSIIERNQQAHDS